MLAHLENILACYDMAYETGKATLSGKEIDAIRETVSLVKKNQNYEAMKLNSSGIPNSSKGLLE